MHAAVCIPNAQREYVCISWYVEHIAHHERKQVTAATATAVAAGGVSIAPYFRCLYSSKTIKISEKWWLLINDMQSNALGRCANMCCYTSFSVIATHSQAFLHINATIFIQFIILNIIVCSFHLPLSLWALLSYEKKKIQYIDVYENILPLFFLYIFIFSFLSKRKAGQLKILQVVKWKMSIEKNTRILLWNEIIEWDEKKRRCNLKATTGSGTVNEIHSLTLSIRSHGIYAIYYFRSWSLDFNLKTEKKCE